MAQRNRLFKNFDELRKLLSVEVPADHELILPTKDEIRRFEKRIGHRIPASYARFLTEFGSGMGGDVKVLSPSTRGSHKISKVFDLPRQSPEWEDTFDEDEYEQVKRIIICMVVFEKDYVGWTRYRLRMQPLLSTRIT